MNVVTAVSRPVGMAARVNQRRRRRASIRSPARCDHLGRGDGRSAGRGRARGKVDRHPALRAALLFADGRAHPPRGGDHKQHEDADPDRPGDTLRREAERRLDDQRIRQQGCQRRAVAERVEPIRIDGAGRLGVAHGCIPRGEERRGRGEQEGRRPHRHRQDAEEVEGRRDRRVPERRPIHGRRQEQRQHDEGDAHVGHRPAPEPETGHRDVPVQVAQQEDALEEGEHRGPCGRHPAEDRQRQAPDQRLHREQQEGRQADPDPVDRERGDARSVVGPGRCGGHDEVHPHIVREWATVSSGTIVASGSHRLAVPGRGRRKQPGRVAGGDRHAGTAPIGVRAGVEQGIRQPGRPHREREMAGVDPAAAGDDHRPVAGCAHAVEPGPEGGGRQEAAVGPEEGCRRGTDGCRDVTRNGVHGFHVAAVALRCPGVEELQRAEPGRQARRGRWCGASHRWSPPPGRPPRPARG